VAFAHSPIHESVRLSILDGTCCAAKKKGLVGWLIGWVSSWMDGSGQARLRFRLGWVIR
jgi:hypothetical protein